MRRIRVIAIFVLLMSVLAGCNEKKAKTTEIRGIGEADSNAVEDSTIYGKCGENGDKNDPGYVIPKQ